MSLIAVAVKYLLAAGVTGDALVTAIAEMDAAQKPVKSSGATRQARYIEKKKASQNVTNDASDANDAFPLDGSNGFPNPSLTSLKPHKENPPKGGQKKNPSRGTRLTPEWELPQDWGEWAELAGMDGKSIMLEGEKFRDFWIAKSGPHATKANWEATWRNWIRRKLEGFHK